MNPLAENIGDDNVHEYNGSENHTESAEDERENILDEEEEDEDECRVCRGPAEEG